MDVAADNQHKTPKQKRRSDFCTSPFIFGFYVEKGKNMASMAQKKAQIRTQIVSAAHIYRDNLAGKVFLYVYGGEFFEVVFHTNRFMHLTGVNSTITAQDFYNKAKKSILTTDQFFFDQKHPYHSAKKKLPYLLNLPKITNSLVCVVKDMPTATLTYKLGMTDMEFTIGLTENIDKAGNKINDWFLPRTLRVKDQAIDISADAEFVDFIFSKDASMVKYDTISFADPNTSIPLSIEPMLSQNLLDSLKTKR